MTVSELDGDEDFRATVPPHQRMAGGTARPDDWEHRCKRAAFELNIMRGTGVIDMPKLARILEGK